MPAPTGNKNALGNKGGRPRSSNSSAYREQVVKFKGKVVKEMQAILDGNNEERRFDLVKRMGPYCIPRDMQLGTEDGTPILVIPAETINKYATDSSSSEDSGESKKV